MLGGWLEKAEGVIFTNWSIGEFKKVGVSVYGQDYGFANDENTLVETNIDTTNKIIYLKECFYLKALTTSQIAELNLKHAKNNLIVADSAELRLIYEIKAKGCNVVASIKGAGSITYGISLLQDYDLVIEENSIKKFPLKYAHRYKQVTLPNYRQHQAQQYRSRVPLARGK